MDVLVTRIPSTVKFKHSCSFRHRHQQANIIEVWQYSHEWLVWCWSISRWAGFSPKPHSLLVSYFWSGKVHIIPTKNGFIVNGQHWSSNKFDNNSFKILFQICIDFLSVVFWYNWINIFNNFVISNIFVTSLDKMDSQRFVFQWIENCVWKELIPYQNLLKVLFMKKPLQALGKYIIKRGRRPQNAFVILLKVAKAWIRSMHH